MEGKIMRSRMYISRFYPHDKAQLSTEIKHDLFMDLETARADRIERDKMRAAIKGSNHVIPIIEEGIDVRAETSKLKRVILVRSPSNAENERIKSDLVSKDKGIL